VHADQIALECFPFFRSAWIYRTIGLFLILPEKDLKISPEPGSVKGCLLDFIYRQEGVFRKNKGLI
jgi:hypothetical protein